MASKTRSAPASRAEKPAPAKEKKERKTRKAAAPPAVEPSRAAVAEKPARKTSGGSSTFKIKLVRSPIGYSERQRRVVAGLGLRRLHQVVERKDTPEIRGMVAKISHLVEVVA
jgi:large subunit ribosomal protein L30